MYAAQSLTSVCNNVCVCACVYESSVTSAYSFGLATNPNPTRARSYPLNINPTRKFFGTHGLGSGSRPLHITDINYMAPRYRPGRTIVPATKDRFTNNLPDLFQLLCVPLNTNELDKITSNMGNIFSNTLETVAPIKLKRL